MRHIGALSLSMLIGSMLLGGACTTEVTETNNGAGGATGEGAGPAGPVGQGGTATGTGGATTGGAAGTTTAGTGGTPTAGAGGTTGGAAGTATAGTGGTATAGSGGTPAAGAGGTATAGSGGTTGGSGGIATGGTGGISAGGAATGGTGTGGGISIGGSNGGSDCMVRFAMLACDVADTVDVCFRPKGSTSWTDPNQIAGGGPLFQTFNDPDGFYYPGVSIYVPADPGDWDVRLVKSHSPDCGTPYMNAADGTFTVTVGGNYTLALEGVVNQTGTSKPLQWHIFTDDTSTTNGMVNFQTVNALADYTGSASISFCTQLDDSKDGNPIATVVSSVTPLGDSALGQATASTNGARYADMFLLDSLGKTIVISEYATLDADKRWYAFVSGTAPDATGNLTPYLTTCIHDPLNRGDDANGHPLAALTDAAQSCFYYQQIAPTNGMN